MAARKKSTGDVVVDERGASEEPKDFTGFFADEPPKAPEPVEASLAEHIVPGMQPDPVQPTITKLQLHTRAHILGIQGTSDSLVVGDVIESIEPDMLGPIPGFVVRLKRGAPVFMPQASVLAVTVVG